MTPEIKPEVETKWESSLSTKAKEGFYAILDKVRSGLLNNEQAEQAMEEFANKCDEEESTQS